MAPTWPRDAQCLVNVTMDFDGPSVEVGERTPALGKHSHGHYSAKCGVPRILDLFRQHDIRATFFVPGYDAEQYPESVQAIACAGHEVAAHGYLHESFDLGDKEPHLLRMTHHILTEITGKAPVGWRNPGGGKSDLTTKVLLELGYIYDSSEKWSDWPYFPQIGGSLIENFVNLPDNISSMDDYPFYWVSRSPPSEILDQWKNEFHHTYSEGGYFDLMLHSRNGFGSGTPTRVKVLDDLFTFIKGYPGVVFQTQEETARWCLQNPAAWPVRRNPRTRR